MRRRACASSHLSWFLESKSVKEKERGDTTDSTTFAIQESEDQKLGGFCLNSINSPLCLQKFILLSVCLLVSSFTEYLSARPLFRTPICVWGAVKLRALSVSTIAARSFRVSSGTALLCRRLLLRLTRYVGLSDGWMDEWMEEGREVSGLALEFYRSARAVLRRSSILLSVLLFLHSRRIRFDDGANNRTAAQAAAEAIVAAESAAAAAAAELAEEVVFSWYRMRDSSLSFSLFRLLAATSQKIPFVFVGSSSEIDPDAHIRRPSGSGTF